MPNAAQPATQAVSSLPGATRRTRSSGRRKARPEPDIKFETVGEPDVTRVVRAFRPIIRRMLDRMRAERAEVIPLLGRSRIH